MKVASVDYPIIFSAPMILALLGGRKTMTRRMLYSVRKAKSGIIPASATMMTDHPPPRGSGPFPPHAIDEYFTLSGWQRVKPGDRLWVRENFARNANQLSDDYMDTSIVYAADGVGRALDNGSEKPWTPCIHMPRSASRITLVVAATKIEPLLDISETDAVAEGFARGKLDDGFGPRDFGGGYTIESPGTYASAAGMFQATWAKLHPEWDGFSSPDVVALTVTVHKQNIDAKVAA